MYNINSHYQLIFEYLKKIVNHRRILYLFPYGSTNPENIEIIADNIASMGGIINEGPLYIFYDQEPIHDTFNYTLFDYINQNMQPPFVLVTTERNSIPLNKIKKKYNWPIIDYFHHIFAASDWYREYQFNDSILPITERQIKKKFITYNRITGNSRVYRTILIAELLKKNLLQHGHTSYSKICPVHGHYENNVQIAIDKKLISSEYGQNVIAQINSMNYELRIDNIHETYIPNGSTSLGCINSLMESFLYIVTETCFWDEKQHLTEKIFKPIVSKHPFVLLGCANNLAYLKEYGFKTFDRWWDESYDSIKEPLDRLNAVVDIVEYICSLSTENLQTMLIEMEEVLEHNYNLFYNKEFITTSLQELKEKLKNVLNDEYFYSFTYNV